MGLDEIDSQRRICMQQQTRLRGLFADPDQHLLAMESFYLQHARLHSQAMTGANDWSFEDAILDDLPVEQFRLIPGNRPHSIAWILWHISRIEDVAMNILVAGEEQILVEGNWLKHLEVDTPSTGNAMSSSEIQDLSRQVNIPALRAYRLEVGRRTRHICQSLTSQDLRRKVDPQRLERVVTSGALVENAIGVKVYWGKRDIAGLLLMPASRHILVHLNESLTLKRQISRQLA